jgi:hypothetical protein
MAQSNYRTLQIVLGFFSLLFVIGGVFLLYSKPSVIVRVFMHPPESEVSTLLLAMLKEMGGFAIMLAVMLFFAARDPERNVAIIDGLIVGLCVLAATPLISLYTLDLGRLYPANLLWARSVARLAVAGLLYYLRPRETHWKPAGTF